MAIDYNNTISCLPPSREPSEIWNIQFPVDSPQLGDGDWVRVTEALKSLLIS